MRSEKGNQEYDEYDEDDFNTPKKDGPPPLPPPPSSSNPPNTINPKDKNNDRANAIRSKHSVTEQRRRSKINERFQILRDLVPHGDQKRDTASFLLEVIDYVRYLQEKVQKYEGPYEGWSTEPTKLMPWRNSHWRVQSFVGHPQAVRNGSGPTSAYPGKFDDNNVGSTSSVLGNAHATLDPEPGRDLACKSTDPHSEAANKEVQMPDSVKSGAYAHQEQSTVSPTTNNVLNQPGDLTIEGGTISISSAYSQGLLNHLTNALHAAGIDLSKASVSVQVDLGKRVNPGLVPAASIAEDQEAPIAHAADANAKESDQALKRQRSVGGI